MTDTSRAEDIEALIAQFQTLQLRELHVRLDDIEIHLSNEVGEAVVRTLGPSHESRAVPVAAVSPPPVGHSGAGPAAGQGPPSSPDLDDLPAGHAIVRAPYMGTFYRSPKPGLAPFVEVGQPVTSGTDLCLLEVMKLFTTLRAPATGKLHSVLAADGSVVNADQPLFVVVPA